MFDLGSTSVWFQNQITEHCFGSSVRSPNDHLLLQLYQLLSSSTVFFFLERVSYIFLFCFTIIITIMNQGRRETNLHVYAVRHVPSGQMPRLIPMPYFYYYGKFTCRPQPYTIIFCSLFSTPKTLQNKIFKLYYHSNLFGPINYNIKQSGERFSNTRKLLFLINVATRIL